KEIIRINSNPEKNKEIYKLFLPENFENLSDNKKRNDVEEQAKKREWNYRVGFLGFLNKSISFQYVPAIKKESFFSHLYGKTILLLLKNEEDSLEDLDKEKKTIEKCESYIKRKSIKADFKKNLQDEKWRNERINEIENKIRNTSKLRNSIGT